VVDRKQWLDERREAVVATYDHEASTYDAAYDPATDVHRRFVARLIETVPPGGAILDAACGTAPYAGMVLRAGIQYVGIDQSGGMLRRAAEKWPDGRFQRLGLQELTFEGAFDAVMCIDAMENVPPEDWPTVLGHLRHAASSTGHVYLTVERIGRAEIDAAFEEAKGQGTPVVPGEVIEGDTAGYHFYPADGRVAAWLVDAGLLVVDEADQWLDGYGYRHLLVRARQT
jgi:2-polyprenyl-3-methyl-5-hydroxy-6-metoxy-1,4-benzoquinol methylase